MTMEEAIKILADLTDNPFLHTWEEQYKALHMAIEALSRSGDLISRADAIEAVASITMSIHLSDVICDKLLALPSADAVSEDTQTEEQARFVAKETELAHIEARLENAEKRLQGVCVANFVAEQLDRLRNMTDEERWDFFIRFFSPSAEVVRCKDCRWWKGSQETKHNNHLCKRALDQDVEYWTKADDYCSYGERREDGEE